MSLKAELSARAARKKGQGKAPGTCDVKACRAPAAFRIMFRLWPKGFLKGLVSPATGDMSLIVCRDCAPTVTAQEFFTDHAWAQVVQHFKKAGKAEPERATAEIYLEPLQ